MNMKAFLGQPGLFPHLDVQPTEQLGERSLGLLLKSKNYKLSHVKNV